MAEVATNVRAFTTGGVWTAPFQTVGPTDPTTAYGAGYTELGWLSDKGIVEARAITSTDKYAFQNGTLIRVLRSAEKRTITFDALEDNPIVQRLLYPAASITSGAGTSEVQTLTLTATGGTFTVTYNGQTTAPQTASASLPATAALQTALQGLSTIGAGNVLVTGTAGSSYVLTFAGTLAATNVNTVTVNATSLTGGTLTATTTTPGVAAVTSTVVKGYTGQNLRSFGVDLQDGLINKRIVINNGEAVASGSTAYIATDLAIRSFVLTAYPDVNGVIWTEYSNDPSLTTTVL